jgi:hypothetical protein
VQVKLLGRVRVPFRQKAPRSYPSGAAFREAAFAKGSWPERSRTRGLQTREQSRRRPGCPRRHEEGTCEYRSRIAPRLLSNVSARELLRQVTARRPSVSTTHQKANATGIGWCRQAAERELHRVRGPSARQGVPVRRIQVAEVGKRRRSSEKRVPGGNGTCGREPRSGTPERACSRSQRRRQPASRWPNREAGEGPSRALERASRGKGPFRMEGISGRSLARTASRGRAGAGLGGSRTWHQARERRWTRCGNRDRDVRSASAHVARGRQRLPRRTTTEGAVRRSESYLA